MSQTSDVTTPVAPPPQPARRRRSRRTRERSGLLRVAEAYALVALTAGLAIFFSVWGSTSATFPTAANIQILLGDQAIILVLAIALLFPLVANVWDFTVGANAGLAAIFAASLGASSGAWWAALLAAIAVGTLTGVANGLLVTVARVNSVIATFGMTIVIAGVVQWKTNGSAIVTGIPASFPSFGSTNLLGVPKTAWVGLAVVLGAYYGLRRTPYGRYLYAIGSSRHAASLVGIRTNRLVFTTFVACGALAGVAGALILARNGTGNPSLGGGYTIPAYAAVFLGAATISPGRWNVWGVVVAILFIGILNNGLTLAGVNPYVNDFANGLALLAGVAIANLFARQRGSTVEIQ